MLGRHHRTQRRDRDFELREVGLAGREPLQRQAGPHEHAHEPALHVLRREPDHLIAQARDDGHENEARPDDKEEVRRRDDRVDEDGDNHHRQQEICPATNVRRRELLRRLRCELDIVLVCGDRFVLGSVVLEHTPDILHAADRQ